MGKKRREKFLNSKYKKYYQQPPLPKPITQKELDKGYKDLISLANYVSNPEQPVYIRIFPQKLKSSD